MAAGQLISIKKGQVGVFGYGSLLSRESMELTLGRPYEGLCVECALQDWRRSWTVMMPNKMFFEPSSAGDFVPQNIIYLNVEQRLAQSTNGLVYVLEESDVLAFDHREWIYDRRKVTEAISGAMVEGGEVYTYVAKTEWLVEPNRQRSWAAIRRSYLDIIDSGLRKLGTAFAKQYEASTDEIRSDLVFNDSKLPGSHPFLAERRSPTN